MNNNTSTMCDELTILSDEELLEVSGGQFAPVLLDTIASTVDGVNDLTQNLLDNLTNLVGEVTG